MDNRFHEKLIVSSAPHAVGPVSTRKIMSMVLVALIPAFAVGIYQFGYRAATLTIVCVVACVVFEYLMNVILKKKQTVGDMSAVLTGVLLAFNLPAGLPYWIAVVGCFAAIVVVKQLFGGYRTEPCEPCSNSQNISVHSICNGNDNMAYRKRRRRGARCRYVGNSAGRA